MHHAAHYFAPVNLKGALISLAIGLAVYFGFIRTALVRDGRYIDVWPARLDIERGIYRPLLLKLLPFALAVIARLAASVFDWTLSAAGMLLRRGNERLGEGDVDETFAVYPKEDTERGTTSTLAYGFALAGAVLIATFAWVLLRIF